VLFFGSVLLSTYLFGRGPGYVSGILGSFAGASLFMPSGALHMSQIVAQACLFLLEAVCVTLVTDGFNHSKLLTELQAQALEHSEAHYRVLTEVSPQVTWEADVHGYITYTNQYWQEYAYLTATQSLGTGYLLAIDPKERQRAKAFMRQVVAQGRSFQAEVRLRRAKDGQYRWHLLRGRPVTDEAGHIYKWVGVAVDIEEQKRIAADLQTAVRSRDNFLSTASHELKTPLTSMQLMTQMMRRNWERGRTDAYSPEKLNRLFGQIDKSVQRLTRIIDDMLDVSRISTGKLTFKFEPTDLETLLHEVVERLAGQIEASGVTVKVHCPQTMVGRWDKFRLEQVITNLVINAIRYGEGADIDIMALVQPDGVRLSVRDYGPGVAPGMHAVIFQQFERGMAANPSGGLGLGLFLCRQIVERHGGHIGCMRPDGPGAQFDVQLPQSPNVSLERSAST
jgi:PAS domain S-box-containing protein